MKKLLSIFWILFMRCEYCGGNINWWSDKKGECLSCGKEQ